MTSPALELRAVSKTYGATHALQDVTLRFEAGSVHALVGRNGAGKSTLVKILAGAVQPTSGEMLVAGQRIALRGPADALARGIATVHQELSLVGELTVAENVLLGRLPRRRGLPLLDHREIVQRAGTILESMGVALDPRARIATLSFAERQVVEIARAASHDPKALLLDEPTSALSRHEVEALFRLVRTLASRGVAILHVTHRLDELAQIADVISGLRDGRHVGTIPVGDATPARLVELMFGAGQGVERHASRARPQGAPILIARGLASGPRLRGADVDVRAGEILGIAGLLGSGRTELLMTLFGAQRADAGEITIAGERVATPKPRAMIARGLALVPEDRKRQGLALPLSVLDNASHASLGRMTRLGLLRAAAQRALVEPVMKRLRLSAPGLDHPAGALSGGNQQKIVVGKWLLQPRRVLLLDEPTKGIDLQARRELFTEIRALADAGMAVIMVSSELEELLETCDRILVLREGRVTGEADPSTTTLPQLFAAAMGA